MTAVVRGSTHVRLPARAPEVALRVGRRTVTLTNLGKVFWPELGITKRDLLQYYAGPSRWSIERSAESRSGPSWWWRCATTTSPASGSGTARASCGGDRTRPRGNAG